MDWPEQKQWNWMNLRRSVGCWKNYLHECVHIVLCLSPIVGCKSVWSRPICHGLVASLNDRTVEDPWCQTLKENGFKRHLENHSLTVSKLDFAKKLTCEKRARGNRKTLKWLKMITKCNFRNFEEYLICRSKLLDFRARSQSEKRRTKR